MSVVSDKGRPAGPVTRSRDTVQLQLHRRTQAGNHSVVGGGSPKHKSPRCGDVEVRSVPVSGQARASLYRPMNRLWRDLVFWLCLVAPVHAATLANAGGAQEVTVVTTSDPCTTCIELTQETVLGLSGEPLLPGAADVERLKDGRVVVLYNTPADEISVFSSDGSTSIVVGRDGEGPGEYRSIRWIRSVGDYLHVFDPRQARRTILDPNFDVVSSDVYGVREGLFDVAVSDNSSYVVNARFHDPARVGLALHAFDSNGAYVRSFDESDLPSGFGTDTNILWQLRLLHMGRDDLLWSADVYRYRITLWNASTGERLKILDRPNDWFPKYGAARLSPQPPITAIQQSSDGLVWVLLGLLAGEDDPRPTLIEVIDPGTAVVVATTILEEPQRLSSFVGDGIAVSWDWSNDDLDTRVLRIWKLSLRR